MPTRQERGQFGNLEAFCGEPLNAVLIAHRRFYPKEGRLHGPPLGTNAQC